VTRFNDFWKKWPNLSPKLNKLCYGPNTLKHFTYSVYYFPKNMS
jgi:hypothetical protein